MTFALTMDSAQAWGVLALSIASALGSLLAAYFSARAKANSAAIVTQAKDNNAQLTEIHAKADTAIAQNETIKEQTDGHYTALVDLLKQIVEGMNNKPAVVTMDATPRKVRKEDLERHAATTPKDEA